MPSTTRRFEAKQSYFSTGMRSDAATLSSAKSTNWTTNEKKRRTEDIKNTKVKLLLQRAHAQVRRIGLTLLAGTAPI